MEFKRKDAETDRSYGKYIYPFGSGKLVQTSRIEQMNDENSCVFTVWNVGLIRLWNGRSNEGV